MDEENSGSGGEKISKKPPMSAEERRNFIREQLKKSPIVSFQEVIDQCGVQTPQTLYNDVKYFEAHKMDITFGGRRFLRGDQRQPTADRRRTRNREKKMMIAQLAVSLVAPENLPASHEDWPLKNAIGRPIAEEILEQQDLDQFLSDRLMRIWMTRQTRQILMDSGSSCEAIASELADVRTPAPDRRMTSLRVITNSWMIARALTVPKVSHSLTMVGGTWDRDTDATIGLLAERSLSSFNIEADFSIIGTTQLDLLRGFCADSEDEAELKSQMLAMGRVKCVVADSGKLNERVGGLAVFAPLSGTAVDCILTDEGIVENEAFLKLAKDHGVRVLVARSGMGKAKSAHP